MNVEQAKAFLVNYANTTPKPSNGKVLPTKYIIITHPSQFDRGQYIKLQSIKRMAAQGYSAYSQAEIETVKAHPNLVELFNTIEDTSLWIDTSKTGMLRANSLRFRHPENYK